MILISAMDAFNEYTTAQTLLPGKSRFHSLPAELCSSTSRPICVTHAFAKASSVKRRADALALRRMASVSCGDMVRACRKPSANSDSVLA